ncbi:protein MOR1 [Lactuca sativa]|uniref:protein MOR1 n=1 Tax=Lactuca sativa TaxID=4236 RepID=UPI001C690B90|nr:protein MOR1 [Lactuca sativa]
MSEEEKLLKDAKKLPWEARLLHKNWKVRNDANIDLAALCDSITDPKDNRIRELGRYFKKTIADSNAPVQDKALDALIAYLKAADADAGRYAKEVCDAIAAKCLTGRPKTVEKAQMVFMLWVELEAVDAFLDVMEKAIKNKVAKAVVPAIDVMFQALSEFGSKVVPPKRILKMLPELFDHQDQNVRASSKGLTLELCRWIGRDNVKSILFEKMRDTMKKELEAELVNATGAAKPTRKIRSEQDKELEQEVVGSGPAGEESAAEIPEEIDEYELVDPVDILTPLEKSKFWKDVKSSKWLERKNAVEGLNKLASAKRIAPGDFIEVCRALKKLVMDVNLAVSVEAVQAIGNLASGLRTHFSASSRFLLPILLEKLKEKKPTMAEALSHTLKAMHKAKCLTLADIVEDVKTAVKNKVPHVRSLTLNWVANCVETSNKATILKVHKDYVPICMECLNDGTPEVRDAAFSVLASIGKIVGMRPLEKSLEKLDDIRRKKLSEMIGISGSGASTVGPSGGTVSSAQASDGTVVKKSAASMLSGKNPAPAAPTGKKVASGKTGASKKADGPSQSQTKTSGQPEDVEPGEMSLEEIETRLESLIQAQTIADLKSNAWQKRSEALNSFKQEVEALQQLDKSVEILIRLLCVVPGWSDKHIKVQQLVIEVVNHIASTASKFSKKCVVLCIGGLYERLADIKTRTQAMKCLTTFSEAVGPGFIFERMFKIMKEQKNPKISEGLLLWMVSAVEDFGVAHLKLKDVIDFCKNIGLQSSASATRNATIKLIGALHKFVGPDIKAFFSDVKPSLLTAVEAECQKNPFEGAGTKPKKTVKASDAASSSVSGGGLDGLPREDISSKIPPAFLKEFESSNWKVRLQSIEAVNKIVEEANKRIQPNGTVELFGALRGRLYDSNKNITMATLTCISGLASAMGPAVDKSSKGILSDVLKCLGDNKKQMRECTLATLDSWVAVTHLDKMIPYIATCLTDAKLGVEGRKDLFDWLCRKLTGLAEFLDAISLLRPVAIAMTDKSVDVRKAAETFFGELVRVCGAEMVMKNVQDIQGPALTIVLERLKSYGPILEIHDATKTGSSWQAVKKKVGKSNGHGSKHGSKVVSSKVDSTKDSKPEPQALLNVKDSNKDKRERSVALRFKFEELRLEHIQDLENDLMKYLREDLHTQLLSTDFKKQVDGIEMLQKELPSITKEIIEVLDILLKWFVLRICESNTSCLLKVLEFLPELFDTLRNENYTMNESEASILLPCLIEKSGHENEKVLEKMRELMKQMIYCYSASKTFPYIMEGLRSRNNRTRTVCGDLVGFLLDNHYVEITEQLKSLNTALDIVTYCSPDEAVEGMKILCQELETATNDPEGNLMDDLAKDADRIVCCLAYKVAITFDFSLMGESSRPCKYVLNTLMQIFQNKRLAHVVSERTLENLITKLLLWLLDERVPRMDNGSQLLKALNVLVLKILDTAERTLSFVILISLLKPQGDPSNESFATRSINFSELVVKCLIKLTKALENTIDDVNIDRILQSIHVYLEELGVEEIRRRAGTEERPFRMVKTLLYELVKLRGPAIKDNLSMVPIDMEPQPIILAYIDLNLQIRMLMPAGQTPSMPNNPMPTATTHSAECQIEG